MIDNIPEIVGLLDHICMPGVVIAEYDSLNELTNRLDLGFGLEIEECYSQSIAKVKLVVSHAGMLKFSEPNHIWIDSFTKFYVPCEGDRIIGEVKKKTGACFLIDYGGPNFASLGYRSFQHIPIRRNPSAHIGDVVYCQVVLAGRGIEPEVTCINSLGKSKWMGVIDNCTDSVVKVDVPTVRKLLNDELFPLLSEIGFDISSRKIIIGTNGWIWIDRRFTTEFVEQVNCIKLASHLGASHITDLIRALISNSKYSTSKHD